MPRRRLTVATIAAMAAGAGAGGPSAVAALDGPAASGATALEAGLADSAKRAPLALDVTGTAGADALSIRTAAGDVIVSVPAPATVDAPGECTQNTEQQFTCDASLGIDGVRAFMRAGGDLVDAKEAGKVTNQYGGRGNDTLFGGRKFDFLNGQRGNADKCRGKRGPETIERCEE
jgi:hypothetical protein